MSEKAPAQWDIVKFVTTLNYFGEVPFIGSFRWLQQWLGHNPTVAGKALNSMKKQVIVAGDLPTAMFDLLQERVSQTVALSTWPRVGIDVSTNEQAAETKLCESATVADTVVICDSHNFSNLIVELSAVLRKDSDIVRQNAFDFTQTSSNISAWGALDDVVMGGVSEGAFFLKARAQSEIGRSETGRFEADQEQLAEPQSAVFAGQISTRNSGGFSSVRTRNFEPAFNFAGWAGLWLRVKGDGQRYKFIVRNSQAWDSPAYVYIFDTVADEWIDVKVPLAKLVPTFRTKTVPSATPFNPSQTVSFQLMLSKFEYDGRLNPSFSAGPFELAVAKIEAYRQREGVPLVIVGAAETIRRDQQQSALAESGLRYRFIEPENQDLVEAITAALI